jgi:hypothetical protein
VRTYQVEVMVVRIDLFDARDGQPVGAPAPKAAATGTPPRRRESALRESVSRH